MKKQTGFTLIELMIVIAIIAILAAIAIPAFQRYLQEGRMTKTIDHFEEAIRVSKAEFAKRTARSARTSSAPSLVTVPSLIEIVNPDLRRAAIDATYAAFEEVDASGDDNIGRIGLTVAGVAGQQVVTITHGSAYGTELAASTHTVNQVEF